VEDVAKQTPTNSIEVVDLDIIAINYFLNSFLDIIAINYF
jgi:hypothetical protein